MVGGTRLSSLLTLNARGAWVGSLPLKQPWSKCGDAWVVQLGALALALLIRKARRGGCAVGFHLSP